MRPREFAVGDGWPHAVMAEHHGARVAQALARRLAAVMAEQGLSAKRLGVLSGVNRQTIANLLAGSVWPDLLTIASLEEAVQVVLWPGLAPEEQWSVAATGGR